MSNAGMGDTWTQLGGALNTASDSSADDPSLVIDYQNRPVLGLARK